MDTFTKQHALIGLLPSARKLANATDTLPPKSLIAGSHSAKAEPAISYTKRHTLMSLQGIVYILTNKNNTTLYTGVTRNLRRRVAEHKLHINRGFSDQRNWYITKSMTFSLTESTEKCN